MVKKAATTRPFLMTTIALRGNRCAFSWTTECLALLTSNGRLRIFETDSGKCSLNLHSGQKAADPRFLWLETKTALLWGPPDKDGRDGSLLLLGSRKGVEAVDIQMGEVKWRLRHEGGVFDMTVDLRSRDVIFCSMMDHSCGKLDICTGNVIQIFKMGKHKAQHLLALDGLNKMCIAGSRLILWDTTRNKKIVKYTGHPTDICAVAASPLGNYVLSAAEDERHVAVWKTKKKEKNAVCLLSMEHPAVHLDTEKLISSTDPDASFVALAVSEIGVVYVWQCQHDADNVLQTTLWAKLGVKTQDTMDLTDVVFSAKLRNLSDQISVLVVHGNAALPAFECVSLSAVTDSPLIIELETSPSTVLGHRSSQSAEEGKKKRKREVTVLGADNRGEPIQVVHHLQPSAEHSTAQTEIKGTVIPSTDVEEMTLGERLQRIEQKMDKIDTEAAEKKSTSLSASSAAVLIHQINQSGDMELYHRAMRLPPDIQTATAKQLTSHDAVQFLHRCTERLQLRPKDASAIVGWIRAILKFHAAYLMSSPDAQKSISHIYQMIETRLNMFDHLMTLSGRIDLLLAQVDQKEKMKESFQETTPQVTVEMNLSDDEAVFEELEYDEGEEQQTQKQESEGEDVAMAEAQTEEVSTTSDEMSEISSPSEDA